jgi:vitamin B12 transporter
MTASAPTPFSLMPSMLRLRLVAVLALLPATLHAQQDTTRIAPMVVTATRLPTPANALTAAVTVLHGADLRAEGLTHVGDALRRVPGLALARTSSFGSQHTLFVRGGQSNYTRVLVDGVPLNEPGGVLDLGRVTLDNVERIEVVRGPASVLYGSEAVAGVIQIFTRTGTGAARWDTELGGGSYGTERLSLGGSGAFGAWGWTLQGDHHATDGILPYNNEYVNDGAASSLAWRNTRHDLRLTTRYNTSIYRYPTGSDGSVEDRNAERTEHRLASSLDYGYTVDDRVQMRLMGSAMDLLPRTNDGADDAGDTSGFYGFFAKGTVRRRLFDARTIVRLGTAQFLTLGTEYTRDTERSASVSQSEFGDFPDQLRAARETRAFYVQGQGSAGRVDYTVGGRLDDNSAFGIFRTARVGTAYRVSDRVRVRASAGTAFKAPSFFENFATGFTVGNPALRPERTRSADVGVELALPRASTLTMTAFAQKFRDLIQYNGAAPFGDPNYYNIAAANAGGVEVEATLPALFGVEHSVSHTWTDTRVADAGFNTTPEANFVQGGRLLRRPEHVTAYRMRKALVGGHSVSSALILTGEREDRDFATFPATIVFLKPYATLDLGGEFRLPARLARDARLTVRIENALDVRTEQIAGFATPGRLLYAGLKLQR